MIGIQIILVINNISNEKENNRDTGNVHLWQSFWNLKMSKGVYHVLKKTFFESCNGFHLGRKTSLWLN